MQRVLRPSRKKNGIRDACSTTDITMAECTWLYLAISGCTWLYLVVPGCTLPHLALPGCTWIYLAFVRLSTKAILLSQSFQQKPSYFRRAFNESHPVFVDHPTKVVLLQKTMLRFLQQNFSGWSDPTLFLYRKSATKFFGSVGQIWK